ncbi:nuclear nucleic acid-binding protein C1D-like [Dendronephthya gigantea]|uniref:nuclear nucleic acid-binding protein C1D-like n=1 Tax=Dendronephthya gigantea TaxID=151771 RepID=UPI0010693744|nr:nuclear nucleic acid-binding protein C1D-like [Dendronephthya gigantea]
MNTVEETLDPLLCTSSEETHEKLNVLDRAKLDLMMVYAVNSMFWIYLITQGVNPKDHGIKHELDRVKDYMKKIKDASDKKKASLKIDKAAARRFVKGALANPAASGSGKDKVKKAKRKKELASGKRKKKKAE